MGQTEIYTLLEKKPMTSKEMARILQVRQASITNAVNKLVKAKIVKREFKYTKKLGRQYIYSIEVKNGS